MLVTGLAVAMGLAVLGRAMDESSLSPDRDAIVTVLLVVGPTVFLLSVCWPVGYLIGGPRGVRLVLWSFATFLVLVCLFPLLLVRACSLPLRM